MNEDQQQKLHTCRFCKQSFSNGKKLGGHMRCHLALISAFKNMGNDQESKENINSEKGLDGFKKSDHMIKKVDVNVDVVNNVVNDDGDDVMMNDGQQEVEVDQDSRNNVYVLRENPKRSWRVSNSGKEYGKFVKKRCDSRKGLMKESVCGKCGKSFGSLKALYGHMRCHSVRRSKVFDESCMMSSASYKHDHDDGDGDGDGDEGEVAKLVRKKRSCTRYKSPKVNDSWSGLSSFDDEVEIGAICLMMLSRGVRDFDEVKMVISSQDKLVTHKSDVEFEFSVDGPMEFCGLENKCNNLGLKKELVFESGSGQMNSGWVGSNPVRYNSAKKPRLCDQEFGDVDATDYDMLERRSKEHNSPICLKEIGSGRALGCHKRAHTNIERKVGENNHVPDDVHRLVKPDIGFLREVSTMVLWGP